MKISKRVQSVLCKYLLTHLTVLIIPLTILGIVFYRYSAITLKANVEYNNLARLAQLQNIVDARIKELERIATKISYDKRLSNYFLKSGEINTIEGVGELGKYMSNSALIDNLYLYFRGDENIYSAFGTCSLNTLTKHVFRFDIWSEDCFYADMNTLEISDVRKTGITNINDVKQSENVMYLCPVKSSSIKPFATVMFIIRNEEINNMISDVLGGFTGAAYILDKNNNILFNVSNGDSITYINDGLIDNLGKENVHSAVLNKEEYSIISQISEVTGWKYIMRMPTTQFLNKINQLKTLIWRILVTVFMLGVGTSVFLSISNYKPIKRLIRHVKILANPVTKNNPKHNEIEAIHYVIDEIFNINEDMKFQIQTQRSVVRDHILTKVLTGEINDFEEKHKFTSYSGIILEGPFFQVVTFSLDKSADSGISGAILRFALQLFSDNKNVYAVKLSVENVVALVINTENPDYVKKQFEKRTEEMELALITDSGRLSVTAGVGKVYNEAKKIELSFIEAMAALDYKLIKGSGNVIYFDEVAGTKNQIYWYPYHDQILLVQSLKQGNIELFKEVKEEILNDIKNRNNELSIAMIKSICFDIINIIIKALNEMEVSFFSEHIESLINFNSLDELSNKLDKLGSKVCKHIKESKESSNERLRDAVTEYIQANFKSYSLSLKEIAEQFGISPSYLSRFFKDQTGYTYNEYVRHLRFEEAKRMLIYTEESIKEIVRCIGYIDVPNFVRTFRRIEGITPGKFREIHLSDAYKKLKN